MSNDEMIAQCVLFFIAAYDTTTTTISLASYHLALNPDLQERLYQEIESNLEKLKSENSDPAEDPIKQLSFESLAQFEYLSAVINETLRMHPPVSTERQAAQDIHLETADGAHQMNVKKDDIIHIPVYSIHHDPIYHPDPDTFNPDRFLGEPAFHKYAYLPFGSGPRNCVARSLALLEAKMALLNVVYRFKLSPCKETKVKKNHSSRV